MLPISTLVNQFAVSGACKGGSFLGFPTWYAYLPSVNVTDSTGVTSCVPQITRLTDVWLIVAAIIEILLRVAALAAVAYVIWGGFEYITSQGEPDKTAKARSQIINALVGLAIAVSASVIVSFVARSIH
jgi:hypothetical protein